MIIENGVLVKVEDSEIVNGTVEIPEWVTKIGNGAFFNCNSLQNIEIPEGVTSLENNAFWGCRSLQSIEIPEGVTYIGSSAFADCNSLQSIALPEGVTTIGAYAFADCNRLQSIEIPEGVTEIGKDAFKGCSRLQSIEIPEGVTYIEIGAFDDCSSLQSIVIPEGVTSIRNGVFSHCSSLQRIEIPEGVKEIGRSAFANCSSLQSIEIPEGVTSICESAFSGCSSLQRIEIPEGVTTIGEGTFADCRSLQSIEIPEGVTTIGEGTFADCRSLQSIEIPEGVTEIEYKAFSGCSSLQSIKIPEGVTRIGVSTFDGCNSLQSIEIPEGVTEIGKDAFKGCTKVKYAKVPNGMEKIVYIEGLSNAENLIDVVYGEDAERFKTLKSKSLFKNSRDYDENIMTKFYYSMHRTIGIDEMERLITVEGLSPEDLNRYYAETDEVYQKYFEKKYELKGNIGTVAEILRTLSLDNKKGFEIYKGINEKIEERKIRTLEELWRKIKEENPELVDEKIEFKIKELSDRLNKKQIEENLSKIEGKINRAFNIEGIDIVPAQRDYVKELIKGKIREEYREKGIVEAEGIVSRVGIELEENPHAPYVVSKKEEIKRLAEEIVRGSSEDLNRNVIDVLREVKAVIGRGWIRKLKDVPSKLTKEEIEGLVARINSERITKERIIGESNVSIELREGIDKDEVYKELEGKEVKGIITYNQIEQMFGGMQEPYSEEFRNFFRMHREEILSNPEYYTRLSNMHNNFESIIHSPAIAARYEEEGISVEHLLGIIDSRSYEGMRPGEEEMAAVAREAKLDANYYSAAQEVFEKMKERENTSVPPVTVEEKGKKYRGRILRVDDPLIMFVGNITKCCQEFGNVGEGAMLHSATERNGGVFVVEEVGEDGRTSVIGQSWVWRNKGRLCFDNIEIPTQIKSSLTREESEEILGVYEEAGKRAIETDRRFLEKQLREGKIDERTYREYVLREVTVGVGCNDLNALSERINEGEIERASLVLPEEAGKGYKGTIEGITPWIDSKESYILAKAENIPEKETVERQQENETKVEAPTIWYGKEDEVESLRGREINRKIRMVQEIEKTAFVENQHMLQECQSAGDIAYRYGIEEENLRLEINKDATWYMIYEESEDKIYIADLAMVNGVNSQNQGAKKTNVKLSTFEVMARTYEIMVEAGKNGKHIRTEATNNTSYLNLEKMKEKGLINVESESKFNDGVDKTSIEFSINVEEMEKELEVVKGYLARAKEQALLRGVANKKNNAEMPGDEI